MNDLARKFKGQKIMQSMNPSNILWYEIDTLPLHTNIHQGYSFFGKDR